MLKVATQFKVAGKVNGKTRKPEDIGQELEVQLLQAGKRMLADSAAKPDMLATCSDDLKLLKRALAVCTMPPGKEKRFEVQRLSGSTEWNVTQKT